ncbi:MAG: MFS transporter [Polyangiales bacterium]|nr:MFS transporter [Myxococcales bacterium]
MSQTKLLADRRLWPLFWTQFLGAFNDNFFKTSVLILVAYRELGLGKLGHQDLVLIAPGIFILPFFLFSAHAGQITDRYSKTVIARLTKAAEIAIMLLGAYGFFALDLRALLAVLFLMGVHSTFFGPTKYSILPQLLREDELVGGNALVETGTFLAILVGTTAGGLLILGPHGPWVVSAIVVGVAVIGLVTSMFIPKLPPQAPEIVLGWNPIRPVAETFRIARKTGVVFQALMGISWFWFFGAALVTLLTNYAKEFLQADEGVFTTFLVAFCVGIAAGSLLCERLSDRRLELGLVPLGSIGMSIFVGDLFFVGRPAFVGAEGDALATIHTLFGSWAGIRIVIDLAGTAIFGGFFTVPLYTLMQQRSDPKETSRVVAGNNIMNSLFMVVASGFLIAMRKGGLSIPQMFGVVAVLNAVVALYIYKLVPEFLFRFAAWVVASLMYRMRIVNSSRLPVNGPCVVVANHVSFVDWLLLASAVKTPMRFVMYHGFMKRPVLGYLFRDAKVIPIAPAKESEETLEAAYDQIAKALDEGEIVCLFPEGELTRTGEMNVFKPGIERVLARTPVPVVPVAIRGMWGSFFSRKDGAAMTKPFRRVWSRVDVIVGERMEPGAATASNLAAEVRKLGGFAAPVTQP